ncbi:nucleoside diphosphate kinase 6-like isoform X2 [Photinus pyralis]|uniref:nucleoside diphosphate kinase 6-like isoform X2 n=1 Tax=Photinus pyralis TaxID=7054 RepID=UPI001266F797|nr:nucleoside diphosphate kinase 6-like isoform X2 [Photinus pyralis]
MPILVQGVIIHHGTTELGAWISRRTLYSDRVLFQALIRSGPSDLYILARENAIQEWRDLMGPTKTYKAQYEDPDTIRGEFGLSDTRNATHGSDSVESATREMKLLFPEFNVLKWQENEEFYFRSNSLIFCCFDFVHKVNYK